MRSDIIDITVHLHHQTEKAVLISDTGDSDDAVWLPRSAIEVDISASSGSVTEITLTEGLATEKGLI